jgi:transposase-like protein
VEVNPMTLFEQFDTDGECRTILEKLRWPEGVTCPRCASTQVYRADPRKQFDCASCGYQFSVTSGTIFHDTHLPLAKWFVATYLTCESKKGMSANQMKRTLGVSYKTAWYLCHRIRAAMTVAPSEPLTGDIEADETWIGGEHKGVGRGNWRDGKTMVLGAIEREGQVRLKVDKRASKKVIHAFLEEATEDVGTLDNDEHSAYIGFADKHETVVDRNEEWVGGEADTNTVEGVWSLFKRSIVGSYHQLSEKHLDAYLDEFEWRFDNRKNEYLFRDTLTKLVSAEALEYKTLIAAP